MHSYALMHAQLERSWIGLLVFCNLHVAYFSSVAVDMNVFVYVTVIDWLLRNYGSKQPIPRAQPEGEVCLRRHNSLATSL